MHLTDARTRWRTSRIRGRDGGDDGRGGRLPPLITAATVDAPESLRCRRTLTTLTGPWH